MIVYLVSTLLLTPHMRKAQLVKYFFTLETAQESLHKLNIKQPSEPSKKLQIVWFMFFFHAVLVILFFQIFFPNFWSVALFFFVALFTISGVFAKIRLMLDLVSRKLDLLNWHLDDLNNRWPLFLPRPPDVTFSEFASVAAWRSTHFVVYNRYVRDITPEKIFYFNQAHFQIYSAYKALNKIVSLDLLALTFHQAAFTVLKSLFLLTRDANNVSYLLTYIAIYLSSSFLVLMTYTTRVKEKVKLN